MKSGPWQQILTYLYIRNRDPDEPKMLDCKFMHGMNRISIFMFLIGMVLLIFRLLRH